MGASNVICNTLAYKGFHYSHYGFVLWACLVIIEDEKSTITDADLMLILGSWYPYLNTTFALKRGPYLNYTLNLSQSSLSIHDARTKIIDALLTFIFRRK